MNAPMRMIALCLAACAPLPAFAQAQCPGSGGKRASPTEVHAFYAARAADVVRAGRREDRQALEKLVSSEATYEIQRGDTVISRSRGVAGVMETVRDMEPVSFQSSAPLSGPISVVDPGCSGRAQMLLRTQVPGRAFEMHFEFVDGLLVSAAGSEVVLVEGDLH